MLLFEGGDCFVNVNQQGFPLTKKLVIVCVCVFCLNTGPLGEPPAGGRVVKV